MSHPELIACCALCLALLAATMHLAARLRRSARALTRQLAGEHVIARNSMRLINCPPAETAARIEQLLAEFGGCLGMDRAYLLLDESPARNLCWNAEGVSCAPGWPQRALALPLRPTAAQDDVVAITDVDQLPAGADRDWLRAASVRAWICVALARPGGVRGIIAFDSLQPIGRRALPCPDLLRMASDVVANAIERELLEHDRARLLARMERSRRVQTIGIMASGIAHNFNNIIGGILGFAEIAASETQPGTRTARHLAEIRRAADCGRDLIDGILAFGRQGGFSAKPVPVASLLADASSLLRAALPSTTELVIARAPPGLAVFGDAVQLQQVVMNLVTNASQAMRGSGRVEVDVRMEVVASLRRLSHGEVRPGRYVCLSVRDSGCGFDASVAGRLFEPFFTTRRAGTGLGLATVREIMRDHDGVMHVESTPGAGATFEAWLPAELTDAFARIPPVSALGRGETVLLIDPERDQLLRSEDILAALGYEPVGFGRRAEALDAAREMPARFDAVVIGCGHRLPEDLDCARLLRDLAPQRPILLAAGGMLDLAADELAAFGVAELLRKPLVEAELAAALARRVPAEATAP